MYLIEFLICTLTCSSFIRLSLLMIGSMPSIIVIANCCKLDSGIVV
jgi:hypothetical protein